jgi:ankyrin repeat protein
LETAEFLLQSGAASQINSKNKFGQTPLDIAVEQEREDLVELLRKAQM